MKKIFLLFSMIFSISLLANKLELKDAIERTLQNHPDIKSSSLKVQQSTASYKSAFSDYLPQVNLQANYNIKDAIYDHSWNVGATLKQKIWDFSKTSNLVDASKIDEDISKLSVEDLKNLLAYKVKSLYEQMILYKETIKVREQDLQLKEDYYKQAKALVEQGLKTQADASSFLSAVYLAKTNLSDAKASYEKVKNSLSLYMGEDIKDDVELDGNVLTKDIKFSTIKIDNILEKNYDLKIDKKTIDKNILLHNSTKASHFGSIDVLASYSYIDNVKSYDTTTLGVSLNIPIYSGGKLSAESQKARIGSQIAQEQKASKELALREELESLVIDIKRYNRTIESKQAQLKASQDAKKVLDARYKEGFTTYIEVLDSASSVLNAQLGVLESFYKKSLAINRINYLRGRK